jgi:hypothetical protein
VPPRWIEVSGVKADTHPFFFRGRLDSQKFDPVTKDFSDYFELTLTLCGGSSVTLTDTADIQKVVDLLGLDELEKWPPPQE